MYSVNAQNYTKFILPCAFRVAAELFRSGNSQPRLGCELGCETARQLTTATEFRLPNWLPNSFDNRTDNSLYSGCQLTSKYSRARVRALGVCVFDNRYYSSYGGNTYCLRNTICANADAYAFASVLPFARIPSGWWRIPRATPIPPTRRHGVLISPVDGGCFPQRRNTSFRRKTFAAPGPAPRECRRVARVYVRPAAAIGRRSSPIALKSPLHALARLRREMLPRRARRVPAASTRGIALRSLGRPLAPARRAESGTNLVTTL